jgi:ribosome maturation factor RimP
MVTRQVRLSTPEQIVKKLADYTGKKINIVMCDRTVFFGELKHVDRDSLTFANMRQEASTVPISEVTEVYLDFKE